MVEDILFLVERSKNGDKNAFGKIYAVYFKRIFRFIYYMVENYELAQDLTQETFLKAWRSLSSFSLDKGTIQAFLFAIARNLTIDHQRRKKTVSLEAAAELPSDEDVEKKVIAAEVGKTVHKALSILEDFEKQLVILRYFEEIPHLEISKIVGWQEGAVRVKIHRALKKLKRHLEKNNYET